MNRHFALLFFLSFSTSSSLEKNHSLSLSLSLSLFYTFPLSSQIDRYNLEAAHALSRLPARQRPSALVREEEFLFFLFCPPREVSLFILLSLSPFQPFLFFLVLLALFSLSPPPPP